MCVTVASLITRYYIWNFSQYFVWLWFALFGGIFICWCTHHSPYRK